MNFRRARIASFLVLAPLLGACGSSSTSGNDGGGPGDDAGLDAAAPDAEGPDGTVSEAGSDDASTDATMGEASTTDSSTHDAMPIDAGAEGSVDAGAEAGVDAGAEAGVDAGAEAGVDAGAEAGVEAGVDASAEAGVDAGAEGGVDAGAEGGVDAGAEAGTDGGDASACACDSGLCGSSLTAFHGAQTAGWNFNGNAFYDGAARTAVLVDGTVTSGQAGTVLYKDAIFVDSATVTFDVKFTSVNGRADGLAFLLETDGNTAVGSGYGGFGALGLHGYGVELDIFDSNQCDPGNGNHAGVDLLSPCGNNGGIPSPIATSGDLYQSGQPGNGVGDIADGVTRTVTVQIASGAMSVSITSSTGTSFAVSNLQNVSLPGYVAGTPYYLGFGGGSGSNSQASRAEISNVSVTFGTSQCL